MTERESRKMRSQDYGNTVLESFQRMQQNDELCDFTVSAEGKHFKVHKTLLAATSDYFKVMYSGPMKESKENAVDLKGLSASALEKIIDFIYSGEMVLNLDNLTGVLNASSHLQVQSAITLCSEYLQSLLTFNSSDEILNIADTYSLNDVKEYYDKMILENFEDYSHSEHFLNLPVESLIKYISSDVLKIRSEFVLFDSVKRWLENSQSSRLIHAEKIFSYVRFSLMSEWELQSLQPFNVVQNCPCILAYVSEGLKFHRDSQNCHPFLNTRSEIRAEVESLALIHQSSSLPFEVTALNSATMKFYQLLNNVNGSRDCRVAVCDNFIFICRVMDFGGGTLMNSLCRFDVRHISLHELQPFRRLRIDPGFVAFNQKLYLFGGCNENLTFLDSVECYDIKTNLWLETNPLPQPVHSLAAVSHCNNIYLSGGVCGLDRHPSRKFYCYYPNTGRWESKTEMLCDRRLHEMCALDNTIFVLGGISRYGIHAQSQIPSECFNLDTNQWTMLKSTLTGRSVGHFTVLEGKILSIGREHYNATETEIWMYDIDKDTWAMYTTANHRSGLSSASCCLLKVNFCDERIVKNLVKDKR